MVCTGDDGQCYFDSLLAKVHYYCINKSQKTDGQYLQVRPVFIVTSSAATKSVKTASTRSSPAITFMISELGFVYFFGRTDARKAVIVYFVSLVPKQGITSKLTSRACASAGALPALIRPTALENNCRVWTYLADQNSIISSVIAQPRTWRCSRSSGLKSWMSFCNVALSGFNRKNSLQYPSDLSWSSSSCKVLLDVLRDNRTCHTLNSSSYSETTFCWKTSGRACWVKGDGSILHDCGISLSCRVIDHRSRSVCKKLNYVSFCRIS